MPHYSLVEGHAKHSWERGNQVTVVLHLNPIPVTTDLVPHYQHLSVHEP